MKPLTRLLALPRYLRDLRAYMRAPGAEPWSSVVLRPMLEERTSSHGFDAHYVYLGAWAFRQITRTRPPEHIDVAGQIGWVTCLASVTQVVFIDVRPFLGQVENLESRAGSVLQLPFADRSVASLSCLHVAEHVGLGRYGDPIDPRGTRKAFAELARVLAAGGQLYFALPVGRPSVAFNAHRVHDPALIEQWIREEGLALREFAAVDDHGRFLPDAQPTDMRDQAYACGMFLLERSAGALTTSLEDAPEL
jgi:SAM-dependent methyltransferase